MKSFAKYFSFALAGACLLTAACDIDPSSNDNAFVDGLASCTVTVAGTTFRAPRNVQQFWRNDASTNVTVVAGNQQLDINIPARQLEPNQPLRRVTSTTHFVENGVLFSPVGAPVLTLRMTGGAQANGTISGTFRNQAGVCRTIRDAAVTITFDPDPAVPGSGGIPPR